MADYAHPEALVSTEWVAQHANDPNVRVVEVDVDTKAYDEGHVPGALAWAWNTQLCDTVRRDILSKEQFEELMSASGVTPETTLVIYGDNNNWFAAWAFWQAKIYGHGDVRLMNGGRKKWLAEGRELTKDAPHVKRTQLSRAGAGPFAAGLPAAGAEGFRAGDRRRMVDVRSPQEFSGRDSGASGIAGDLPARRPHSGRAQYSVGQGVQRRRHLQIRRRTARAVSERKASTGPSR